MEIHPTMVPCNQSFESADALVALRTVYYSRFPNLDYPTRTYHSRRRLVREDKGVAGNDYAEVVDSELIGRQAFLLDESLRHACDGKLLRRPLNNTKCHRRARSRGEGTFSDSLGNELLPKGYGWKSSPEAEDLERFPKLRTAKGMALWLSLARKSDISKRVENVSAMNVSAVALQEQPLVGELQLAEALAEEMYGQYIDEAQCCELGGWLNGD